MLSNTKEQRTGINELKTTVSEEGRGRVLTGISERKAVYPPLLNGSDKNFFGTKLNEATKLETQKLFKAITTLLK